MNSRHGRWSRKSDACTECNRSDVPHHAQEQCHRCYNHRLDKDRRGYFRDRWRKKMEPGERVLVDMRPHYSFSGYMTSRVYNCDGEKVVNVRGAAGVHEAIPISRVYPQEEV